MKILNFKLLVSLLLIASLACNLTGQVSATPLPTVRALPTPSTVPQAFHETVDGVLVINYKCVNPVGLWLRSSPEIGSNKLLAIPQGTKLLVITSGIWSRVYLKEYDLYGYVRTYFLENCQ